MRGAGISESSKAPEPASGLGEGPGWSRRAWRSRRRRQEKFAKLQSRAPARLAGPRALQTGSVCPSPSTPVTLPDELFTTELRLPSTGACKGPGGLPGLWKPRALQVGLNEGPPPEPARARHSCIPSEPARKHIAPAKAEAGPAGWKDRRPQVGATWPERRPVSGAGGRAGRTAVPRPDREAIEQHRSERRCKSRSPKPAPARKSGHVAQQDRSAGLPGAVHPLPTRCGSGGRKAPRVARQVEQVWKSVSIEKYPSVHIARKWQLGSELE